jgi:hypothetical protein
MAGLFDTAHRVGEPAGEQAQHPDQLGWLVDLEVGVDWSEFDRGGHFAALEAPDLYVGDVRTFFRTLR